MVECGGFENRYRRKTIGGSNPPLSENFSEKEKFEDTKASATERKRGEAPTRGLASVVSEIAQAFTRGNNQ